MALHVLALLLLATACAGDVLRVPAEWPTIQSAFDVLVSGDTVLVDVGNYPEALRAPSVFFVLRGNIPEDSTISSFPVINPSSLHGSDSLACMILPVGSTGIIENFIFKNDSRMYPRYGDDWYPGGIHYYTSGPVTIQRCVFDSVFAGIHYGSVDARMRLTVQECTFRNCHGNCIYSRGPLTMSHSTILGNNDAGVACLDSGIVELCTFSGETAGWLGLYRNYHIVRQCVFGPGICHHRAGAINLYSSGENIIEENEFVNIGLTGSVMDLISRSGNNLVVRNNRFCSNYVYGGQSAPIIVTDGDSVTGTPEVGFYNNCFVGNEGCIEGVTLPKIINSMTGRAGVEIGRNRFIDNDSSDGIVIYSDSGYLHVLRENVFVDNGVALKNFMHLLDAEYNYWGDPSGPYHAERNPNGLGDAIIGDVMFEPWLTEPPQHAVERPPLAVPRDFEWLYAYPNPFNATMRISFTVSPLRRELVIYNLLGEIVEQREIQPYEWTLSWSPSQLTSGVYFAKLDNQVAKLVLMR